MTDRYREHRAALAKTIGDSGLAVVPAAAQTPRNHDVDHEFRQDSDFFYLTGFHEPDAVAVLVPGHPDGEYHLFVRPRHRESEIWTGYRAGVEGARERFGADAAHEVDELDSVLPRLMLGRDVLFYRLGNQRHDAAITRLLETARQIRERLGRPAPTQVHDVSAVLAEQRLVKGPAEIASLRAACELSAEGHAEAMRYTRPGRFEYQVQAAMELVWREQGSPRNGYPSIVASGPNAIVLHYVENDRRIEDGDLVLIDAACEIDLYSSDITRTFPASGSFTAPQADVYDVVLAAQRTGIEMTAPGVALREVGEASRRVLAEGMVELGLIPAAVDDVLSMNLDREFFMHGVSHWLGLDVHDAGAYRVAGASRPLAAGMCFTVEPGIYVAPDRPEIELVLFEHDRDHWFERRVIEGPAADAAFEAARQDAPRVTHHVPEALLGIGIRIEDDILVTAAGFENLTASVPTDRAAVEALCRQPSRLG